MAARSTVITGVGIIAAPGFGIDQIWSAIASGHSGLKPLTLFQSPRYGQIPVGEISRDLSGFGISLRGSRTDQLALIAAHDAVKSANIEMQSIADRAGVLLGSSVGGSFESEKFMTHLIKRGVIRARGLRFHECSSPVDVVADSLGLFGPSMGISTACSSGAVAISTAAELIQSGQADVMLAGGTDSLSRTTWAGFHSLLLVDAQGCRPFDADRGGMSFGEGAAILVIEAEEHAVKRGAKILARLTGWGGSCDAYHATAPHPEGAGALAAMQTALRRAGLTASAIDYINAHGTGTRENDIAEARAMKTVFGDKTPPFSSTKRFFGHALAASGAIEAAICIEALRRQYIPANPGFGKVDPAIGLSPVTEMRPAKLAHVMSNSFGFGGNNAVLIFSTPDTIPQTRATPAAPVVVTGIGVIAPEKNSISDRSIQPPLPPTTVQVRECGSLADAATLTPNQRRRLSRIIQMAILAARRSHTRDASKRLSIALGTGMGCVDEGAVFLENIVTKDEAEPMPTRFPGSVHNAPAGQVAIDLGAHGLNSAPTMGDISFESALWQAVNQIVTDEADEALAGAVDELNKYPLFIGKRWGLWSDGILPGEAAVVANLANITTAKPPLARVTTVCLGRYPRPFDAGREADWIIRSTDFAKIEVLLIGAKGWGELEPRYAAVTKELIRRSGGKLAVQTYKKDCGEFYSASAYGFTVAVEVARQQKCAVMLYTLSIRGGKALSVIEP